MANTPLANQTQPSATVLVIDDEAPVRALIGRILERRGYAVLLAENGEQGVALLQAQLEQIQVVLVDWSMLGLHGRALIVALRTLRPDVRIIVMSGYTETEIMNSLDATIVVAFIHKPFRVDEIDAILQRVLKAD